MAVWRNHTGNQSSAIAGRRSPSTIDELAAIVVEAEASSRTVRAVGAGHAWSDVALTTGLVIEPAGMSGLAELDLGRPPPDGPPLVRALGGPPSTVSAPCSAPRASRCRTWAATTRRRSPASSRRRRTARG